MGLLATKKDDSELAEALHLEAVLVLDRLPEVRMQMTSLFVVFQIVVVGMLGGVVCVRANNFGFLRYGSRVESSRAFAVCLHGFRARGMHH